MATQASEFFSSTVDNMSYIPTTTEQDKWDEVLGKGLVRVEITDNSPIPKHSRIVNVWFSDGSGFKYLYYGNYVCYYENGFVYLPESTYNRDGIVGAVQRSRQAGHQRNLYNTQYLTQFFHDVDRDTINALTMSGVPFTIVATLPETENYSTSFIIQLSQDASPANLEKLTQSYLNNSSYYVRD